MDPVDVARAYDTVAADYAARLPDTRAEAPEDLAMVDAFAAAVGRGTVLDAGCGAGRMSRYVADRGCGVVGVDLSPGMVACARRDHPDLAFAAGSLLALPVTDCTVGGVLVWYSTIHLPDALLPQALAEVRRVVRPGGHVLVGFQAGKGVRDLAAAYGRFGHAVVLERYRRTPEEMAEALAAAGLREVRRMVRPATGTESDDQAVLLAQA